MRQARIVTEPDIETEKLVRWTVVFARSNSRGAFSIVDGSGRRFLATPNALIDALDAGIRVYSESGHALSHADVKAGRLL